MKMMMILMIIIILMIMMMTAVLAGSPRWRDGEGVAGSADDPTNKQRNKARWKYILKLVSTVFSYS